jgi:hypothetical protein
LVRQVETPRLKNEWITIAQGQPLRSNTFLKMFEIP